MHSLLQDNLQCNQQVPYGKNKNKAINVAISKMTMASNNTI